MTNINYSDTTEQNLTTHDYNNLLNKKPRFSTWLYAAIKLSNKIINVNYLLTVT